jgi:Uncharacterised nucleotidyltransferase
MKLRVGAPDHIILSAALCSLQGSERWPLSATSVNAMSPEEQDALFSSLVARDVAPLVVRAAQRASVQLPERIAAKLAAGWRAASMALDAQRSELGLLAAKVREVSAPILLFRGLDVADNVWPQLPVNSNAAHILIHPPQVSEAKACLAAVGFVQGELDRDKGRIIPATAKQIQDQEAKGGKLAAFRKMMRVSELDDIAPFLQSDYPRQEFLVVGSQVYMICEIDVHLTVLAGVDIPDIWAKTRVVKMDDESIFAQDASDMLWTLATCCYHEIMLDVARPIRAFLDVLAVLVRFAPELDWDHIKLVANRYGLEPGLYYVLRHAHELLGEDFVPTAQLQLFDPTRADVVRRRDWGDFGPRLFNTEFFYMPFSIEHCDGGRAGPSAELNGDANAKESESTHRAPAATLTAPQLRD